jgi:hypothetical protein
MSCSIAVTADVWLGRGLMELFNLSGTAPPKELSRINHIKCLAGRMFTLTEATHL